MLNARMILTANATKSNFDEQYIASLMNLRDGPWWSSRLKHGGNEAEAIRYHTITWREAF